MGLLRISGWSGNVNEIYENLINETMQRTRCCIPCIVQSYDRNTNTVECQPSIRERVINEDGTVQYVNLPLLINVPVVFPSSSSFSMTFPINIGDECLVVFSDLSIDNFWVSGGVQNPVEVRRHDLSDGIAIPCRLSRKKRIFAGDTAKAQFGNTSVEMTGNDILFKIGEETQSMKELIDIAKNHYHIVIIEGAEVPTSTPKIDE